MFKLTHYQVYRAVFSHDGTRLLSGELCSSVNRPILIHLPASGDTCRLWDLDLPDDEQGEGSHIWKIKLSEDGVLLAIKRWKILEMWRVST